MTTITFGTSGWRAIMNDEFTFANVRTCARAIADYLQHEGLEKQGVIIGHDSRFMGEDFAAECGRVLAAAGIPVHLCTRETPTPVIAWYIISHKLAGGINITASHNPPHWNGIKFSPDWGGPAMPETTSWIAERANRLLATRAAIPLMDREEAEKRDLISPCNPRGAYLDDLQKKIDFDLIGKAGLRIACDPMYGTARGYLDAALGAAAATLTVLHDRRDPYFGGRPPEPSAANIPELRETVKNGPFDLGLATDGDADRFGIVDADGSFIDANTFIALAADYLIAARGFAGGLARSVATSHLIDRVAAHHRRELHETPVGFKYIGRLITQDAIVLGGEESAGLSIRGHVPEKDGILACLLAAEMVARRGTSLTAQRDELYHRVGALYARRVNVRLTPTVQQAISSRLASPPDSIGPFTVRDTITIDGTKFMLDNDCWLLIRLSGTEPVARLYAEAPDVERLERLLEAGSAHFFR
jgi:phosphoglucomutase